MKKTDLLMYAKNNHRTITFTRGNDMAYNPNKRAFTVECKPHNPKATNMGNFIAKFGNYSDAEACFKMFVDMYSFETVYIANDHLESLTKDFEERPMTQREEYEEALFASAYGNESLMRAYERKYIEGAD